MSKPCTVYCAIPMTGFDKEEMIQQAKLACAVARMYGLEPWSPVLHENIVGKGRLTNQTSDLDWKWPLDKKALNNCFAFVNLRADEKSFGCEDEYGRHRYSEWQPVVRISPKHAGGYVSIANYQTDFIAGDMHTAFKFISDNWGTWRNRFFWKLGILCHLPGWLFRQLRRLAQ